ncbi:hypothetical protein ACS0TY_003921 [Phlomoides rotata]
MQRIRELKQVCKNLPKLVIPQDDDELIVYIDVNDFRWAAVLMGKSETCEESCRYAQDLLWQVLERSLLKIGSPSVTQKERVQQAEPQQALQVPEPGKADSTYTSLSSKEKVHQAEPPQRFQVLGSGKANSSDTSSSSKLEETEHQTSKPNVSGNVLILMLQRSDKKAFNYIKV